MRHNLMLYKYIFHTRNKNKVQISLSTVERFGWLFAKTVKLELEKWLVWFLTYSVYLDVTTQNVSHYDKKTHHPQTGSRRPNVTGKRDDQWIKYATHTDRKKTLKNLALESKTSDKNTISTNYAKMAKRKWNAVTNICYEDFIMKKDRLHFASIYIL